ncbi:MAG: hypothetical protein AAB092_08345 [Chloroflexota bacterium]
MDVGADQYILYATAPGFRAARLRLSRVDADSVFYAVVVLAPNIDTVATVVVVSSRPRPIATFDRDDGDVESALSKYADGVRGALPPRLSTDIMALAALVPGLSTTSGGVSAAGVAETANAVTLNGLSLLPIALPRAVSTTTRFRVTPWDPTIGGFAGVSIAQTLRRGSNIASRNWQTWTQPVALLSTSRPASFQEPVPRALETSYGGSGAYVYDRLFYSYGVQLSRVSQLSLALPRASWSDLASRGLDADSLLAAAQAVLRLGVPSALVLASTAQETIHLTFVQRLDLFAADVSPERGASAPWTLTTLASFDDRSVRNGDALRLLMPSQDGQSLTASVQLARTGLTGRHRTWARTTSTAFSVYATRSAASGRIPAGVFFLTGHTDTANDAFTSLRFGGSDGGSSVRRVTWEVVDQRDFYLRGNDHHAIKLYAQSLVDMSKLREGAQRLGTFSYATVDALRANRPTGFSRILSREPAGIAQWLGAAAVGLNFRLGAFAVTGGLRVDASAPLALAAGPSPPMRNLPFPRVAASPRLGLQWRLPGRDPYGSVSPLGSLVRGGSQFRAGVGRFRAALSSTQLLDGLASAGEELNCVGNVASPDWAALAGGTDTAPVRCASSSSFAMQRVTTSRFARAFQPSDSWRANVGWSGTVGGTWLSVDGLASRSEHIASVYDVNFTGFPRFLMPGEGMRPVFVPADSIDVATGAAAWWVSNGASATGRSLEQRSDLRSWTTQLSIYAIPPLPLLTGLLSLGYARTHAVGQFRGFDGVTQGDPRNPSRAPVSWTPEHQLRLQWARMLARRLGVSFTLASSSGRKFSPRVDGDVNGDGLPNDLAFLSPDSTADPSAITRSQVVTTFANSARIRQCLLSQVGRVTAPFSCRGSWSTTANAALFPFAPLPGTKGRARLSIHAENVLAGLDALLFGTHHSHGWGGTVPPDDILLRVRGFNPITQRYRYDINPHFGRPVSVAGTASLPWRFTVDVSVELGRSEDAQLLDLNLREKPALVGTRASAEVIKRRYMAEYVDIYAYLLTDEEADSLALSIDQMRRVRERGVWLRARADSVVAELATFLVQLAPTFTADQALPRISATTLTLWAMIYAEREFLQSVLIPQQIRLLPQALQQMISDHAYRGRFYFAQ